MKVTKLETISTQNAGFESVGAFGAAARGGVVLTCKSDGMGQGPFTPLSKKLQTLFKLKKEERNDS
jgi:hypothetical protein